MILAACGAYLTLGLYIAYRDVVRCEQRWLDGLRWVLTVLVVVLWGPLALVDLAYRGSRG